MADKEVILRRHTSLPSLLHLLRSRNLTLLSPEKWEDRNDAYYMRAYRRQSGAKSVLALCFSRVPERYHLWRVFTDGSDGVCIDLERDRLRAAFAGVKGIRAQAVTYKLIKRLPDLKPNTRDLPFIKREPYRDEREFRIIYVDKQEECEAKDFPIDLGCIRKITMNPWMPKPLLESVRATIQSIKGCRHLRVSHTTLLENEQWKRVADRLDASSIPDKRR